VLASWVIVASFFVTLSFYAFLANSARKWLENSVAIHHVHQLVAR